MKCVFKMETQIPWLCNCLCDLHRSWWTRDPEVAQSGCKWFPWEASPGVDNLPGNVLGVPPRKEIGKRQDWTKWGWDCSVVSVAAWKDAVGLCPFPSSGWMVGPLHLWFLAGCRLSREWTWPREAGVHSLWCPEGAENWGSSSWSLNLQWGTIWASSNQQGDAAIPWKVRTCEALWSQLRSFPRWENWSRKTVRRAAVRASEGPCLLTHLRLWGKGGTPPTSAGASAAPRITVAAPSGWLD